MNIATLSFPVIWSKNAFTAAFKFVVLAPAIDPDVSSANTMSSGGLTAVPIGSFR